MLSARSAGQPSLSCKSAVTKPPAGKPSEGLKRASGVAVPSMFPGTDPCRFPRAAPDHDRGNSRRCPGIEMVHMVRKGQARYAFSRNPSLDKQFAILVA